MRNHNNLNPLKSGFRLSGVILVTLGAAFAHADLYIPERDTSVDLGISDFAAFSGSTYNYNNTLFVTGNAGDISSGNVWTFTDGATTWYPVTADGVFVTLSDVSWSGDEESYTLNIIEDSSLYQGYYTAGSTGTVNDVSVLTTGTSDGYNTLFFSGLGVNGVYNGGSWYYVLDATGFWGVGTGTGNVSLSWASGWSYTGEFYDGATSYFYFDTTDYEGNNPDINATFYGSSVPGPAAVVPFVMGMGGLLRRRARATA